MWELKEVFSKTYANMQCFLYMFMYLFIYLLYHGI